jgi:hypothetical protein
VESKTLEQAIDDIMEAIETTLKNAINVDGGKLHDVKSLIMGGKTSQSPKTPGLWVGQGEARLVPEDSYLKTECWAMEIAVVSVIYNTDQYQGEKDANSLAARAKSVLIADRTLGFDHGTFFSDIRSSRFIGSNPEFITKSGNLFSAIYTCEVYFTVIE